MKFFLILIILLSSARALSLVNNVDNSNIISKFIFEVQSKSLKVQILENKKRFELFSKDSDLSFLSFNGFLSADYNQEEIVNTSLSPFFLSERSSRSYGLGLEKQWRFGFKSKASYKLQDVSNIFQSGEKKSFTSSRLELSVTSSLTRDLFSRQYSHLVDKVFLEKDSIELYYEIEQKKVLIQSLLDLSFIIEQKEEMALQKKLCKKTLVQAKKLARKRKNLSVSKRDYLLSLKELKKCEASVELLSKGVTSKVKSFESTYSTAYSSFESVKPKTLFVYFKGQYEKLKDNSSLDISKKDEIRLADLKIQSTEFRYKELQAQSLTDVALEVKGGASGSDPQRSYGQISLNRPFVYVGLRIGLPFGDREAQAKAGASYYKLKALEYEKQLLFQQSTQGIQILKESLKKDFSVYKKYEDSVKLAKSILRAATVDFGNGRLDFFSLTEFNKGLIQEQKIFSSHRIRTILSMVEFLDYYRFFSSDLGDL